MWRCRTNRSRRVDIGTSMISTPRDARCRTWQSRSRSNNATKSYSGEKSFVGASKRQGEKVWRRTKCVSRFVDSCCTNRFCDGQCACGASETGFGIWHCAGSDPEAVRTILGQQYPYCALLPSVYHESAGYSPDTLAIHDIARGTLDVCRTGATGREVEDSLSANFAHPSIDPHQPLYQIDVERIYPDVALVRNSKVQYPFDKMGAELFRTYGKPIETRREKITSAAADLAKSLSIGVGAKREDQHT